LKYYKNDSEYRGEVPLCRQVYARRSGRDRFEIVTPKRTFFLREVVNGDSNDWIMLINKTIDENCHEM
jgi:hypothetical protein